MKKLFFLFASILSAATTTVTATNVQTVDGRPASGTITIQAANTFTSASGAVVLAGTRKVVAFTGGKFSIAVVPNIGSTPTSYYSVTTSIGSGNPSTSLWQVPVSSTPVTATSVAITITPTGGGGASFVFVDGEVPGGAIDGSNAAFSLAFLPSPTTSLSLYRNGILMKVTLDYNLSSSTITFVDGAIPQVGDTLLASYRMVL